MSQQGIWAGSDSRLVNRPIKLKFILSLILLSIHSSNATYKDTRKLIQQPVLRGCNGKGNMEGKGELHDAKLKIMNTR
jgi:hypothetical protein